MADEEGMVVFEALRPLCVKVMSSPSRESLSSLQASVMALQKTTPIPCHLAPYIILPLRATIKKCGSSSEHLLESTLLTLAEVLSRVRDLEGGEMFGDLFSFLCMLLDNKMSREAGFKSRSEELIISALKALKNLLLSSGPRVTIEMYSNLVPLGHCISTLLDSASNSASNVLRSEALAGLCALAGLDMPPITKATRHLQTTSIDSPDFPQAVDGYLDHMTMVVGVRVCGQEGMLAAFLPGVSSAMSRLISSDATTTEPVVSLALATWAHYIAIVLTPEEEGGHVTSKEGRGSKSLLVERSESWMKETGQRLTLLLQRVSILVTSDLWRVRLHLVGWAHSIITHCYSSVAVCVPYLVEILVTLSHDPYPQVSLVARASLKQFPAGDHTLKSLLGEQLHALTSSLPRLIRQHDDTRKVATLQLLAGYLKLSGDHVTLLTHSLPHLSRLVHAMMEILMLQTDPRHVIAVSIPTFDPSSLPTLPFSSLAHVHFRSDKVAVVLREVCLVLGCRGDFPVLMDYMMDQFRELVHFRKECLLFMSYLLLGAGHRGCGHMQAPPTPVSSEEMYVSMEGVVTELVSPDVWSKSCDQLSDHTSRSSDLYAFLIINILFTSVHLLGATFDPLLQKLLYPLLQSLGDDNVGVSDAAMATLTAICSHCNYKSLSHLIDVNADYLIHSISLHLRYMSSNQSEAIQVLRGVVSHGEEGVCLLVRDSMRDLLLSLDTNQLEPQLVWVGLRTLAENCKRWVTTRDSKGGGAVGTEKGVESEDHPTSKNSKRRVVEGVEKGVESKNDPREDIGIEAIAQYFHQYHQEKEEGLEEEEGGGVMDEEGSCYEDKPRLPVEQVCVDIMRRCVHHMSHPISAVRLVVMETLQYCMTALQHDQATLLPEVHGVWPSLLPRLSDSTHPVTRRAWQVILCMSQVCGEFLRKRILEKVWPLLLSSLETMATSSRHRDNNLYIQSAEFKLQCCLLECVGGVVTSLSLPSSEVEAGCVVVASLYMSTEQPWKLQDVATRCLHHLISLDPDVVWLVLQQLATPTDTHSATPTSSMLKTYIFPGNPGFSKYTDNINPLLLTLSSC